MKKRIAIVSCALSMTLVSCATVHVADGRYPTNEFTVEPDSAAKMLGMSVRSNTDRLKKATPFATQVVVGRGERQVFAKSSVDPEVREYDPTVPIGYEYEWENVTKAGLEILNLKLKNLDISANLARNLDQNTTATIEGISGKVDIGRHPRLVAENICQGSSGIPRKTPNAYVSGVYKLEGQITINVRSFENQIGVSLKTVTDVGESALKANGISMGIDEDGQGAIEVELDTLWGVVQVTEVSCDAQGPKALTDVSE